jgi:hypothetical protein
MDQIRLTDQIVYNTNITNRQLALAFVILFLVAIAISHNNILTRSKFLNKPTISTVRF